MNNKIKLLIVMSTILLFNFQCSNPKANIEILEKKETKKDMLNESIDGNKQLLLNSGRLYLNEIKFQHGI